MDGADRVAVIGGGVAGLTAAYVLARTHEVTLFEADDRAGGHAHTHDVGPAAVDSGFIVFNQQTYPLLTRLFGELGVASQPAEMSMSVSCDGCGLEYAGGKGPAGLVAPFRRHRTGRYGARGAFVRLLAEVPRFRRAARRVLDEGDDRTLGEFAASYSPYFVTHFLRPLVATVWSCSPALAGRYPARYLFTFLDNHGMLATGGSPQWRTVTGGSRAYVERIAKRLAAVHTSTPVSGLRRTAGGVELWADGPRRFDAAVVATHADQALRLLAAPTLSERATLGAFRYSRNPTVLHTDASVLPRAPGARASWNYRMPGCAADGPVQVSYDMNRLQRLPGPQRYLVTLGGAVSEDRVLARMVYEHPLYTPESVAAQRDLPALNDGRIAFAGAHHGWGFHEDGCRAGLRAAEALGGRW
ncbi:FAD-dependent oxidoreductase [Streptosporangiaceae bacterium NEAU-GS5]|nr:FAD-dependent oxidoreductase [Streptosporangiaceae bacterium NEAU-GS5]